MTESTAFCLFCNQPHNITEGRTDTTSGRFIGTWINRLELEDCTGLKQTFEGKGSMFLCPSCREIMHKAIENNAKAPHDAN